jgi:hypothetical protein
MAPPRTAQHRQRALALMTDHPLIDSHVDLPYVMRALSGSTNRFKDAPPSMRNTAALTVRSEETRRDGQADCGDVPRGRRRAEDAGGQGRGTVHERLDTLWTGNRLSRPEPCEWEWESDSGERLGRAPQESDSGERRGRARALLTGQDVRDALEEIDMIQLLMKESVSGRGGARMDRTR